MEIPKLQCNRCEHEWIRRKDKLPNTCPKCSSPYWNKERVRPVKMEDKLVVEVMEKLVEVMQKPSLEE